MTVTVTPNLTTMVDCDVLTGNPVKASDYVFVKSIQSANATITPITNTLNEISRFQRGRWRIVDNQMICYGSDNETPLATFNLLDKNGNPAMEKVFERVPV